MIIDSKKIIESKKFQAAILTVVTLAVVFGVFQAGVFVGFHKASFLFKSGDNFYRAFGGNNDRLIGSMGMGMFRDENTGGHGAVGKVIKVNLPNVVVVGSDSIEKNVIVNENTVVRQLRNTSGVESIAVDQYISVLGTPNDQGQIVAKFIRIVPAPSIVNTK